MKHSYWSSRYSLLVDLAERGGGEPQGGVWRVWRIAFKEENLRHIPYN